MPMTAEDGKRASEKAFWREKALDEMTAKEWESLCDGCGLCCQIRLEDEDTGEIALSDVACRFLDLCSHRCKDYANRQKNVPDCVKVTPMNVHELTWPAPQLRLPAGGRRPRSPGLAPAGSPATPMRCTGMAPQCSAIWSARMRSIGGTMDRRSCRSQVRAACMTAFTSLGATLLLVAG